NPDALVQWATESPVLQAATLRIGAAILAALVIVTAVGAFAGVSDARFLFVALFVNALVGGLVRPRVGRVLHAAADPARELKVLADVLARLERESFSAERLKALRGALDDSGGHVAAVRAMQRLRWIVELHDWEHNILF